MSNRNSGFLVFGLVMQGAVGEKDRTAAHKYGVRIGDRVLYFSTAKAAQAALIQVQS